MKAELLHPRRPELVEADLQSLDRIVAGVAPPPPGDFAAELQWRAWDNHRAELEAELEQARRLTRAAMAEEHIQVRGARSADNPLKRIFINVIDKARHLLASKEQPADDKRERVLPGRDEHDRSDR